MEFYDRNGKVVCYVTDNGRVYSWSGKPLGTVHNERIFRLSGQLVGWIKRGFLMGQTANVCCLPRKPARRRDLSCRRVSLDPQRHPSSPSPKSEVGRTSLQYPRWYRIGAQIPFGLDRWERIIELRVDGSQDLPSSCRHPNPLLAGRQHAGLFLGRCGAG